MSIQVHQEAKGLGDPENCFNCGVPTRTWITERNLPCCMRCASILSSQQLPTEAQYAAASGPMAVHLRQVRIA